MVTARATDDDCGLTGIFLLSSSRHGYINFEVLLGAHWLSVPIGSLTARFVLISTCRIGLDA